MLIPHKGHTDTIQVYSVTVMTHVKALQAGHSSQGTSEPITPALMDLALPRFPSPDGRSARPHPPWIAMTDSPASPAPVRLVAPLRSPSPCLNLDALSSDESARPGDISAVPICISDASSSPVNPEQVLLDDDLPTAVHVEDRRQVIRIRNVPPELQVGKPITG